MGMAKPYKHATYECMQQSLLWIDHSGHNNVWVKFWDTCIFGHPNQKGTCKTEQGKHVLPRGWEANRSVPTCKPEQALRLPNVGLSTQGNVSTKQNNFRNDKKESNMSTFYCMTSDHAWTTNNPLHSEQELSARTQNTQLYIQQERSESILQQRSYQDTTGEWQWMFFSKLN